MNCQLKEKKYDLHYAATTNRGLVYVGSLDVLQTETGYVIFGKLCDTITFCGTIKEPVVIQE
jgi:hypothetical protein